MVQSKEVNPRNTKAEILAAYNDLIKKVKEDESEKPRETKEKELKVQKVDNASKNSVASILKNISTLKLDVSNVFDQVEENLLKEFKKLTEIQEAIEIEKKNLEDLYDLSANTDSLAAILLAHKQKREEFEIEMRQKEEELTNKLEAIRQKLESEIEDQRIDWAKEKKENEQNIKEEKEKLTRDRKREEEEYQYKLTQNRKKEEDDYLLKKTELENELKNRKSEFERDILDREKSLAEKEDEFRLLKKQVEQFPKELEKAINEAVSSTTEKLENNYKYERDLLAKENEGQLKLNELTIQNLKSKIAEQDSFIKQLTMKSDSSEKTVKDIAIKALESSSKVQVQNNPASKKEDKE